MVVRFIWVEEVAGSNPVIPIIRNSVDLHFKENSNREEGTMNSIAIMTIDSLGIVATGRVIDKSIWVIPRSYAFIPTMHPE